VSDITVDQRSDVLGPEGQDIITLVCEQECGILFSLLRGKRFAPIGSADRQGNCQNCEL
jgi:hypothetical protein